MTVFDLVAFADLHIGGRWDTIDPTNDILAQLDEILSQVKPGGTVINLGDTFHSNTPYPHHYQEIFRRYIKVLVERKVNIITLEGNHDHKGRSEKGSALDPFLEISGCGMVIKERPTPVDIGNAVLVAVPHMTPDEMKNNKSYLAEQLQEGRNRCDGKRPLIGLCHLDIPGAVPGAEKFVMTKSPGSLPMDMPELAYPDIWLAGHIHKPQEVPIRHSDGKRITIVGSPVRHDFSERGDEKRFIGIEFMYLASTNPADQRIHPKMLSVPLQCQELVKLELDFTDPNPMAYAQATYEQIMQGQFPLKEGSLVWVEVRITDEEYVTKDFLKLEQQLQKHSRLVRKISPTIVRSRDFRMKELSTAKSDEEVATEYFRSRKRGDVDWLVNKATEIIQRVRAKQ